MMLKSIVIGMFFCCVGRAICFASPYSINVSSADTTIVIDTALPDISFPLTVKKSIPPVAMHRSFATGVKQQYLLTDSVNSIKTSSGFSIWIKKEDLQNNNGSTVQGDIFVNVVELSNTQDFIYAKAPTMSRGALLTINHAFYIEAVCNNTILQLKKGKSVIILAPANAKKLFIGDTLKNGNINWLPASDHQKIVANELGLIASGDYYANKQSRIDQYLKLDLGDEYLLPDAASVYMIFKKQTMIAAAVSTEVPVLFSCRNMPIGEEAYALAVVSINGKLYAGKTDFFAVTDEDMPTIQLTETTTEQLAVLLSTL